MYPRSGFRSGGTCERTLVPVCIPGEHPNVPSLRFLFRGTSAKTTLLETTLLSTPEQKEGKVLSRTAKAVKTANTVMKATPLKPNALFRHPDTMVLLWRPELSGRFQSLKSSAQAREEKEPSREVDCAMESLACSS